MPETNPNATSYPQQLEHLNKYLGRFGKSQPETMKAFQALHGAATKDGALPAKTKELIALAIGVATGCDDCIGFHTRDALKGGATKEEIHEALSVAIFMGGGPALMYVGHAVEAIEQFESEGG